MLIKDISEICEIIGGSPSPKPDEFNKETNGIPFIKMKDLGRYHLTTSLKTVDNFVDKSYPKFNKLKMVKKGAILLPRSGSVALNHRAIVAQDSFIVSHICALMVKDSKEIHHKYLYYHLTTINMIKITKKTTGLDAITFQDLGRIKIPIPTLSIQEKIIVILDEANKLVQKDNALITKYNELSQSLFLDMFGDPLENPYNFEIKRLEDVCTFITKGTTPKKADIFETCEKGFIPFLKVYHIADDGSIDFKYKPSFVSKKSHNGLLKRSKVYCGDVLMNIVGPPLGKIGLVSNEYTEWNVNQAIAIFRCLEQLNPIYLLWTLKSKNLLKSIISQAIGIRQQNINLQQCRDIKIPIPTIEMQNQFITRVQSIQKQKQQAQASLKKSEELFNCLLQKAFKGELVV